MTFLPDDASFPMATGAVIAMDCPLACKAMYQFAKLMYVGEDKNCCGAHLIRLFHGDRRRHCDLARPLVLRRAGDPDVPGQLHEGAVATLPLGRRISHLGLYGKPRDRRSY